VTSGNPLHRTADGTVFVQDEASQLIAPVVDAHPVSRVLDLCASPGGKSIAMAADMEGTGRIIASDVRPKRLALLRDTVLASGAGNIAIVRVAASGPLPFAAVFDRVLVDAPCSGLGTVRRDPDVKWRRHEADLRSLSRDQLALLTRAAAVLGRGGRLIYATCSSEPDENEQVVDEFLSREAAFARLDLRTAGPPLLAPFLDDRGDFRTSPSAHGLEAFYAAVLVRR
jgi:16S rRNA (cytosine967-C5)-methyltransferase